MQEHNNNQE